jgi:hypothetical protein
LERLAETVSTLSYLDINTWLEMTEKEVVMTLFFSKVSGPERVREVRSQAHIIDPKSGFCSNAIFTSCLAKLRMKIYRRTNRQGWGSFINPERRSWKCLLTVTNYGGWRAWSS